MGTTQSQQQQQQPISMNELRRRIAQRGITPAPETTREELEKLLSELERYDKDELIALRLQCEERGIKLPSKDINKADLVRMLQQPYHSADESSDNDEHSSQDTPPLSSSSHPPTQSTWQMLSTLPSQVSRAYEEVVNAIIRPPRANYDVAALGRSMFNIHQQVIARSDFMIENSRGQKLQCSWWGPKGKLWNEPLPVVIYLHGNSSCRAEACEALSTVLFAGATLFAFDFSGSGLSDGEYVTLGYFERDDLKSVVNYVRESGRASTIALWGRSMGAVTAIMYVDKDPSIAAVVCDSPFSSLRTLAQELVDSAQLSIKIPTWAVGLALRFVRTSCLTRAKFDINLLEPIECASRGQVPALFGAANGDTFIRPSHVQAIHDKWGNPDKIIVLFPGMHNTTRPQMFHDKVYVFLSDALHRGVHLQHDQVQLTELHDMGNVTGAHFDMPSPMRQYHHHQNQNQQQQQRDLNTPFSPSHDPHFGRPKSVYAAEDVIEHSPLEPTPAASTRQDDGDGDEDDDVALQMALSLSMKER